MPRPIVGITCATQPKRPEYEPRFALNRAYVRAVENAGGTALILPTTDEPEALRGYLSAIGGLLLSGGVDIHPSYYGREPHPKLEETDADRDATELPLIRMALAQKIPLFAICRGVQALNVAMGGTLYQDLPTDLPSNIRHQQAHQNIPRPTTVHSIQITPDCRLRSVIGSETMETNSLHHQALEEVAPGLIVTARASDGVIEAVEAPDYPFVLGVQFHPEETAVWDEKSQRLFTAFVQALRQK